MSGGDSCMPEPCLNCQKIDVRLQQDHCQRRPEHVGRDQMSRALGRMLGYGGAAHDVRSSEARQAPSVGAGEYRYLFNATDATLAQKRVERCDQIARQRTNLVNKTVVADA